MEKEGSPPAYAPPPYSPEVPKPGHTNTVHVTHSVPVVLGPNPVGLVCPHCHAQITTSVEIEATTKTHLFALLLCLVFWPCVCVPYCVDS
ncbi:hypothetical protein JTB14_003793 [Gonioctena quinquepunctata]|nr:hypothetical protein JTB14_003793 [Gonioctena quinquepunctata]